MVAEFNLIFFHLTCSIDQISAQVAVHPANDAVVIAGSTAMLTCVGYGVPSPSVTWRKDGSTLPTSRATTRVEQLTEAGRKFTKGSLEICSTTLEDAGTYRCTVSNHNGSSSAIISLTVEATAGKLSYGTYQA